MADENRVFDVAKPGSSKPETGSKPMVVGHKIIKDPTLKESDEETTEEPQKVQQSISKTIKPISKDMVPESDVENADTKNETDSSAVEAVENGEKADKVSESEQKEEPEAEKSDDNQANQTESAVESTENSNDKKEESLQDNAIEQEENLQKIIKEKTYNVHIEEASTHAFKTFLKTFFVVAIIGILALIVLIDAEIIDLGVTLPFDIL